MAAEDYEFTVDWFSHNFPTWNAIIQQFKPARILEIGSYEGRSTCYMIEKCSQLGSVEIHCVDTWEGSIEHQPGATYATDMTEVEKRFDKNISLVKSGCAHPVTVIKHKKSAKLACAQLICDRKENYFDLVYIDGSHQAPDVLVDAVLTFQLLRIGGLMIFDDYLWSLEPKGQENPLNMPKPAIDAFLNIFQRKMSILPNAPLYQIYTVKNSD